MENEIWKDITGYEGYYQVSNLGKIRSLDRIVNGQKNFTQKIKGKIKKLRFDSNGFYLMVDLNINGVKTHIGVFNNEVDAAKAYDKVAKLHHGEFAKQNFK